ncbi:acetyltransferase [Staphylococcus saprophyticus]|nr:acetyltransferase [Staphylococcus saprophyticus]
MSEPTKEELLAFMRKHEPEKVDSITDTESAIRHFRCMSKVYKEQRDTLIDDIAVLKANISRLERENRFLLSRKDNLFDSWRDENKRSVALSKRLEQLERQNEEQLALLKQFRKLIDYKLTLHQGSSMYRDYRSKLDQLGVK